MQKSLKEILNAVSDAITVHDTNFKMIYFNKAAKELLGIASDDVFKKAKCFGLFHGLNQPPEDCPSCACFNTGKESTFEIYEPNLDKYLEIRALPLFDSENRVTHVVHMVRDITEKKELEQHLLQSQKMESIGRLAGSIAHDFSNIISSIIGYADILKMEYEDTTTTVGKAADVIFSSAEKAANLTKQLLGFARKGKYHPIPLDLNKVVETTVKMTEKIFKKKVEVIFDLEKKLCTIEADKNQMNQILTNLIINARDAMPNGGKLIFRTKNVYLEANSLKIKIDVTPGHYVRLSVSDTGIGMTEEVMSHMFEPFFTTKGEGEGTGLGLASVYGIVKNHQGFIDCNSKPGLGTTFNIYLPTSKKNYQKRR